MDQANLIHYALWWNYNIFTQLLKLGTLETAHDFLLCFIGAEFDPLNFHQSLFRCLNLQSLFENPNMMLQWDIRIM